MASDSLSYPGTHFDRDKSGDVMWNLNGLKEIGTDNPHEQEEERRGKKRKRKRTRKRGGNKRVILWTETFIIIFINSKVIYGDESRAVQSKSKPHEVGRNQSFHSHRKPDHDADVTRWRTGT